MAAPEIKALENEVGNGLGALIEATEQTLGTLQRQRDEIDRHIAAYARKLRLYQGLRHSLQGTPTPQLRLVTQEIPPTKREAILAFLTEHPGESFKLIEIRRALVERGWMANDKRAIHALEVAAIGMARRGEIERVRGQKGFYKLAPHGAQDVLLTNVQGEGGEAEQPGEGPGNVAPVPSCASERVATR